MWRVLIVEDDQQMRSFFAASVEGCAQLSLIGNVASVAEAKACLDHATQSVDVLLKDLGLPDGSGLQVIRYARTRHPAFESLVILCSATKTMCWPA